MRIEYDVGALGDPRHRRLEEEIQVNVEGIERIQARLESITRRWWFFVLFVLLQIVPPYAAKGYDWSETGTVTGEILSRSLVFSASVLRPVLPIFKIVPILLIGLVVMLGNRLARTFSLYVALNYVLLALLQSIAVTETYGLGIIIINLVMFLLVALFWIWEAVARVNDLTPHKRPLWRYWVVPLAFVAFWYPANPNTMMPEFNLAHLFTNVAGLTFCMMTPVYLALLTLYHPGINRATLRVTGLVGIIIGLYNMLVNFVLSPGTLWWNGVLHIPLVILSIYGFVLSFVSAQ
jgi:hypothetical protein